ncbi:MAG: hypothetical protein ABIJ47_08340 [Candidatus Bathyarchaeota archaeon]
MERLRLVYRIVVDPLGAFRSLRDRGFRDSLCHVLTIGWVTALISGVLSLYGVDYSNPSNAGGSAQIFAPWALETLGLKVGGLAEALFFAGFVMAGYLVLAAVSAPVLASAAWLVMGRPAFGDFQRLSAVAVVYGMTPGFLFGWAPNPFYAVGLWATVWQGLAVREVFSLSWGRAVVVVLLWIVVVGVLHDLAGLLLSLAM